MVLRIALFIVLAFGLTGFGVVVWLGLHPSRPHVAPPRLVTLLGTDKSLPPGRLIQPSDFVAVKRSPGDVPPDAVRDTPANRASYTGAMVRHRLSQGEVLSTDLVIRPGDHGFLAAVLHPGMRAVSVGVDAVTGAAGLIWPGDHVDLLLTQKLIAPHLSPAQSVAAETVLTDVRVIAIDQHLVQGATGSHSATSRTAQTVTLEVTPEQAERVEVASHLGRLSLIVRPSEKSRRKLVEPPPVYGGQVSPALAALSTPGGGGVTVFQGASSKTEYQVQ